MSKLHIRKGGGSESEEDEGHSRNEHIDCSRCGDKGYGGNSLLSGELKVKAWYRDIIGNGDENSKPHKSNYVHNVQRLDQDMCSAAVVDNNAVSVSTSGIFDEVLNVPAIEEAPHVIENASEPPNSGDSGGRTSEASSGVDNESNAMLECDIRWEDLNLREKIGQGLSEIPSYECVWVSLVLQLQALTQQKADYIYCDAATLKLLGNDFALCISVEC